ncbi:MAG TPA: alpha/beta hydrolase [Dehalococcoidia bacterium]|jgi:triacylglycerol esterase/lipase EstA (alpha/beta hydrolase family)|nr:alpha/beta hydrolase [Dehalococcoidia bacterium]
MTTLDVASDTMNVIYTPAVFVTHGWESHCNDVSQLVDNLRQELAVVAGQVKCGGYDSRAGVISGDTKFGLELEEFRRTLPPDDPVQIVAHSMGGLVARYWYEKIHTAADGPVGSISMLGTPNNGALIADLERLLCPVHAHILFFSTRVCVVPSWALTPTR